MTTPMLSMEPRSASFVTTAGLISTQTSFTPAGVMLPTPMLWSIELSIKIISAPAISRAYSRWASIMSVKTPGNGTVIPD